MSSDSEDPFGGSGDSEDTNDLLTKTANESKPIAKKKKSASVKKLGGAKKRLQKKKKDLIPDADADDESDDEAAGLFDSDEEEDTKKSSPSNVKTLSRRERMEALQAKKRAQSGTQPDSSSKSKNKKKKGDNAAETETGNKSDSGDSYDSGTYQRTADDDDFIDVRGEDEEMVREYYAEQHFDDERPDDEMELKPKSKGSSSSKKRGPDSLSASDRKDIDNPLMRVVERMKKKKKVTKRFEELKEVAMEIITRMESAANDDEQALKKSKPGFKKIQMLPEVLSEMTKREMVRPLLEADLLIVIKRWIQPLPSGSLGNVTVRMKIIDAISKMNGESGIENDDLRRSDFGKLVMTLYMHKDETPAMKKMLKALIEQWSRRIFQKSGDMKNLESAQAHRRGDVGVSGYAKAQAAAMADNDSMNSRAKKQENNKDLSSILSGGVKQARDLGRNRVRVPYGKGFQYQVRPENKLGDVADKKTRVSSVKDDRKALHKKMLEKKKKSAGNMRSQNISIEGRQTK
mmetsp:Transcript_9173/g.10638  ORF Transcript_9173/g.10638 Transcript_9173/m.10638 type:complete len:517 (-) Transcript_9173:161-1711(-)